MSAQISRRSALVVSAALGLAGAGAAVVVAARAPRLYVFVPTLVRASALVPLLGKTLAGADITVFGRFADFQSAVATMRPEAAISLGEGLEAVGLRPSLQGVGRTGTVEPYLVLTPSRSLRVDQLERSTLGVVDVVGRRALPLLVQNLLGLRSAPRVRRVLKLADLLPLLSLKLADGIVIPARFLPDFREASRLPLRVIQPPTANLRRAAVAYPKGDPSLSLRRGIENLNDEALDALGVLHWEVV